MCLMGSGRVFFLSRSEDSSESLSPAFRLPHYSMRLQDVSSPGLYFSFPLQPCLLHNTKPQAWRHQHVGSLYCLEGLHKSSCHSVTIYLSLAMSLSLHGGSLVLFTKKQTSKSQVTATTSVFNKVWPCWRKCPHCCDRL